MDLNPEQLVVAALVDSGIASTDGSIEQAQAHEVARVVARLVAEAHRHAAEAADFAGQMSEARRNADATTDRLRDFARRLIRLDDATDPVAVEDRRTITLTDIITAARSAWTDTAGYVTSVEASRRAWAAEALNDEPQSECVMPGPTDSNAYPEQSSLSAPCACLTAEGAAAVQATGRFTLPQCAVHPTPT